MARHRLLTLLLTALLALGVAACGGDDGGSGGGGSAPDGAAQTETGTSGGAQTETSGDEDDESTVAQGDAAAGEQVFGENCAGCHGDDGGGGTGPALAGNADAADSERVVEQIREGGGGMPPFQGQLEDKEIADVAAYVVETLAQK